MSETVVAFSTYSEPALGHWLSGLVRCGCAGNLVVVLDSREPGPRDVAIWEERTQGRLPRLPLSEFPTIPFHFVVNHNGEDCVKLLREINPLAVLNCGTPRILKEAVLSVPRVGVVNVHPGDLPYYRGCTSVEWAVLNDDPISNTAHLMGLAIDEGPILQKGRVAVAPGETYVDVRVKVYQAGYQLMGECVRRLLDSGAAPDGLARSSGGTYWKPIDDERLAEVKRKLAEGRYRPRESPLPR